MKINGILIFVGLLVISVVGFYIFWFGGYPISHKPEDWGPFGDFFGGVLNPIIAGAGLLLLFRTIKQNEMALNQAKDMITQGNEALVQSQKMIEQGNSVINQNAQELHDTREEVRQAREAQEKLAEIESTNLKENKIAKYQNMYEIDISIRADEIRKLLEMNIVRLQNTKKNTNYMSYSSNHEPLILAHDYSHKKSISILIQALFRATELCNRITKSNLLKEIPHKNILINIQKLSNNILVNDLLQIAMSIKGSAVKNYKASTYLINDGNKLLKKQCALLDEAILINNMDPYTIMGNETVRELQRP